MPLTHVHVERHEQKAIVFYDARAVEGGWDLFVYRDGRLLARIERSSVRTWYIEEAV